jgi:hypothetical protein
MKWVVRLLLLAGAIALGYWAWTVAFPDPRKVVRRRLEKLAQAASFSANEGQITKLANIQKLGGFFSEQVVVNVETTGTDKYAVNNRDELMQGIQAARMSLSSAQAKFVDPKIEMTSGDQEAIIGVVLTVDVGGDKDTVVDGLKIDMKKIDGDWLITRAESVQ